MYVSTFEPKKLPVLPMHSCHYWHRWGKLSLSWIPMLSLKLTKTCRMDALNRYRSWGSINWQWTKELLVLVCQGPPQVCNQQGMRSPANDAEEAVNHQKLPSYQRLEMTNPINPCEFDKTVTSLKLSCQIHFPAWFRRLSTSIPRPWCQGKSLPHCLLRPDTEVLLPLSSCSQRTCNQSTVPAPQVCQLVQPVLPFQLTSQQICIPVLCVNSGYWMRGESWQRKRAKGWTWEASWRQHFSWAHHTHQNRNGMTWSWENAHFLLQQGIRYVIVPNKLRNGCSTTTLV